jgi:hypothetical protein
LVLLYGKKDGAFDIGPFRLGDGYFGNPTTFYEAR